VSTKGRSRDEGGKVSEYCSMQRAEFTRENGSPKKEMAAGTNCTLTVLHTLGCLLITKPRVKASILGEMGKYTMANGRTVSNMDLVFGKELTESLTLVSG